MAAASMENCIRASREFDKAELVKGHVQAYAIFGRIFHAAYTARLSGGTEKPAPAPTRPLPPGSSLRRIELSDLEVGKVHRGCVVYGTLCVQPFRTAAIQTVLEDAAGKAVLMSICDMEATDFMTKYREGRKVAINEPYFKQNLDGTVGISVDNPLDVEDPRVGAPQGTTMTTDGPEDGEDMADFLRTQGNIFYAMKDWSRAKEYYTKSVENVERMRNGPGPTGVGSVGGDESTRSNQLLIAYSNRSEVWLQLEDYENALSDSLKALELNSTHEKSVARKGRSLIGLKRFGEAISCLEEFLISNTAAVTQRASIEDIIKRAKIADEAA